MQSAQYPVNRTTETDCLSPQMALVLKMKITVPTAQYKTTYFETTTHAPPSRHRLRTALKKSRSSPLFLHYILTMTYMLGLHTAAGIPALRAQ
jgi:hypothetical protein